MNYMDEIKKRVEAGEKFIQVNLEWSKIFPNGNDSEPNEEGLAYFDEILDECKRCNIEPYVTVYNGGNASKFNRKWWLV